MSAGSSAHRRKHGALERGNTEPADAAVATTPMRRRRPPDGSPCELCAVPHPLGFHHLIPRHNHHKNWFRQTFGLAEMRARGAWLCRVCHNFIHDHFDEATLGRRLNTLEALRAEPEIARHLVWAARQRASR